MAQVAAQSVFLLVIFGFIGAAGILFTAISAREWAVWLLLKQYGKRSEAKLISLYVRQSRAPEYNVMFQPSADAEIYVTQVITRKTFLCLQSQDTVEILYLRSCRAIARLTGEHVDTWGLGSTTIAAFVFILVFQPLLVVWLVCFAIALVTPRFVSEVSLQRFYSWHSAQKQKRKP